MPGAAARTVVLVHGAWHGAWCWARLLPLLEAQGLRVLAPDLPGMGADTTAAPAITLEGWATFVAGLIERQPQPVTLVGHSRAGLIISRAAELVPAGILRLVYLAAYLLPAGGTVAQSAREDKESLVPANMIPAEGGITCTLRESILRDALFGRCSQDDFEFARQRLVPEPLRPLVTPLKISTARFGSLPRAYIECTHDRTISLAAQRRMQLALPCAPVFTLDSDHSPFLSRPAELASVLGQL